MGSGSHFNRVLVTYLFLGFQLAGQQEALERAASLDAQHKCAEAEQAYQVLLAAGSASSALLNNIGYHYLDCGVPDKARSAFESVLKANPAHRKANLELARLALGRKEPLAALSYLSRIRESDAEVQLVRAESLDQSGKHEPAAQIIAGLFKTAGADPRVLFAIGMTCGRLHLYAQAEKAFGEVLTHDPDDFDVLYNLGLSAARASDNERAQRALAASLKLRPEDVDTLYELGRVEGSLHDYGRAIYLLAQARKLAPRRADVILALARTAQMAGYYGDSLLAYDEYLTLRSDDDLVRRDRALVHGFSRGGLDEGVRELRSYVEKHPKDGVGFYDLAQLSDRVDRVQALSYASTAVQVSPNFEKARYYRAWLLEKLGRFENSASELRRAIALDAGDVRAFDLLGLDYLNLEKPAEAQEFLQKAVTLAPNDPDVLFHLSRSLLETGRMAEAQPFLKRFKEVKDRPQPMPREDAGIIEAASLSSSERASQVVQQLRQYAEARPADVSLKLNLGSALLSDGKLEEACAIFRELLTMNPEADVRQKAGGVLLRFGQYTLARQFLEGTPAKLDLAIAVSLKDGPQQAIEVLGEKPDGEDAGDWYLLKSKLLDAVGRTAEADQVLVHSTQYSLSRPRLAADAALLLARHGQGSKSLEIIDLALKSAPDDPDLLLTKAVVLSAAHRQDDAERRVKELEHKWPEWDLPYLVDGLLLGERARVPEAKQRLQAALALGADNRAAQCALDNLLSAEARGTGSVLEVFFQCRN